jgi:uncharacterized membrane protein
MDKTGPHPLPAWLPWSTMIMSLLGVADSVYLTIAHYAEKTTLACPDTGIINCQKVTSSQYSEIFGLPLPLLGLLFFVAATVLSTPWVWRVAIRPVIWGRIGFIATGVPMVLWLIYVELFKLDAICLYCTGVHILAIALFALTAFGTELLLSRNAE